MNRLVRTRHRSGTDHHRGANHGQEGQSMLEMAFGSVFLVVIVIILFEMAMVFKAYIGLLNASREGAVYASAHPDMVEGTVEYDKYLIIAREEAQASGLDITELIIEPPLAPDHSPLMPIRVTLRYPLVNPTEGIILPWVGRMGLFRTTWISAATEMPIR